MGIIIDIILIAIVAVSVFFAAKKGLVGTLFSLLSTVVAVVLAILLAATVGEFLSTKYVKPAVKSYIIKTIDKSDAGRKFNSEVESMSVENAVDSIPDNVKKLLKTAGVDTEEIKESAVHKKQEGITVKESIADAIAAPISSAISKVIAFVGLFILLFIGLGVVAKLITAVFNAIPITKGINKTGGLIFGLIRGLIIIFAISVLFSVFAKNSPPDSKGLLSQSIVDSTVLLKTVANINPMDFVLKI